MSVVKSDRAATWPRGTVQSTVSRARELLAPAGKALVVSLLVVTITFVLGKLVLSDPGRLVLGTSASPEAVEQFNIGLGLNRPLPIQFADYLSGLFRGDFGTSYAFLGVPVWDIVAPGLAVSGAIAALTAVISTALALLFGTVSAVRRGRALDFGIRGVALVTLSSPTPFVALVLILLFSVRLGVLPAGGWSPVVSDQLRFLVLPVAALTFYLTPILLRVVRERVIAVLDEPFIEGGISRGLGWGRILLRHVLPNSAGPLITVLAFNLGGLLSGAVIAEVVFGIPGLGRILATAVASGDMPVLQAVSLLAAILVTLCNVAAEYVQRVIDPRLRA